jgi:hypothetical protein
MLLSIFFVLFSTFLLDASIDAMSMTPPQSPPTPQRTPPPSPPTAVKTPSPGKTPPLFPEGTTPPSTTPRKGGGKKRSNHDGKEKHEATADDTTAEWNPKLKKKRTKAIKVRVKDVMNDQQTRKAVLKKFHSLNVDSLATRENQAEVRMSRQQKKRLAKMNRHRGLTLSTEEKSKQQEKAKQGEGSKDREEVPPNEDQIDDASVCSKDSVDIQLVFSDDGDYDFFERLEKEAAAFCKDIADGILEAKYKPGQ